VRTCRRARLLRIPVASTLACPSVAPQTAVKVYHAPGVSPAPLSAHAEEVVEVLSCYFPVSFIPPKNDPFK